MPKEQKRNPAIALQFVLSNAIEYLNKLNELHGRENRLRIKIESRISFTKEENEKWQDIGLYQRAFRTALILDVGRMFDTYRGVNKVISFKTGEFFKIPVIKKEIDQIHGESIISEILKTRDTWSAHIGDNINDIISTEKICQSNLVQLFKRLKSINTEYTLWFIQNKKWKDL